MVVIAYDSTPKPQGRGKRNERPTGVTLRTSTPGRTGESEETRYFFLEGGVVVVWTGLSLGDPRSYVTLAHSKSTGSHRFVSVVETHIGSVNVTSFR